ncbi:MAG: Gfo/Idh/MocA family oxidoreductase [Chloroflexi bacterium]|nr:Gfo/Idh/MocA family oxidoreductase [Chloroflexota bacterium]
MIRIAIIGYGYWGPNLARNVADAPGTCLVAVSDARPERLEMARRRHPEALLSTNCEDVLSDSGVDAVIIATPVESHFDLASRALEAGKHVLLEKPMTATAAQAEALVCDAKHRGLTLMVDHTFVYSSAVRKIKELVDGGELGEMYYFDAMRINLGLFRHDVNVVWDLAAHDLSILDYLVPFRPRAIAGTGVSHVVGQLENIAYLTVFFNSPLIAHINVNWLAPVKVRQTLIGGSKKMILFNDIEPSEKVKVYDRGITLVEAASGRQTSDQLLIGYRIGDVWAPQLDITEALRTEVLHFVQCIVRRTAPLTDGEAGLRVVRLLEAATWSMLNHGAVVELP